MKKIFFYLMLSFIVGISGSISWIGKTDAATIILVGSVAMILLANLDKLKSIKFYGLEAELKETIREANATIEQLKALSVVLAEPAISLIATSGLPRPMPLMYRVSLVDRINAILRSLSISPEEIQRMNDVHHAMLRMLHGRHITQGIENVPEALHLRQLPSGQGEFASPNDYETFLTSRNLMTPERRELVEDLQHFIEHRELRRPKIWLNE